MYEIDTIFNDSRPTLHVVHCTEQEAEIHIPFCHKEYDEQKKQAQRRFHVYERPWRDVKYWKDPDYPFDWTEDLLVPIQEEISIIELHMDCLSSDKRLYEYWRCLCLKKCA